LGTQEALARRLTVLVLAASLPAFMAGASMAAGPYTPKRGSAERKAVLDVVRKPVERGMKQKVIFIVDKLRVQGKWAFVQPRPRSLKMGMLSFKGTRWEKDHKGGFIDDGLAALLRRDRQGWLVIQWVMGPTDVAWEPWPKEYGAPTALFR